MKLSVAGLGRLLRPPGQINWTSDDAFTVGRLRLHCVTDPGKAAPKGRIAIMKSRVLVEAYAALVERIRPARAVEFGFRHAGSSLFLAKLAGLDRLVGIDLRADDPALRATIRAHREHGRIALKFGVRQDDAVAVREIVEQEFVGRPLDLIVDDASHLYGPTRATFEACFGYLRPGGAYVIEDWGWAHWPGFWQVPDGQWSDQPALSNLIFELVMVAASRPDIVARVDIAGPAMAIITRGDGLPQGQPLQLDACHAKRGRPLDLI